MIPDRKWCFFIFERFGHVFCRKSFVESLVRSVHVLVKTRLSRFFLGNLKETERCFLGLACYLPLGGGAAGPGPWEIKVFNQQGGQQKAWSLPDESLPSWAGVGRGQVPCINLGQLCRLKTSISKVPKRADRCLRVRGKRKKTMHACSTNSHFEFVINVRSNCARPWL